MYAAEEVSNEDDELAAGLAFVEGLEGNHFSALVFDLQLARFLECLRVVKRVVVLRLVCRVDVGSIACGCAVDVLLRRFRSRGHCVLRLSVLKFGFIAAR